MCAERINICILTTGEEGGSILINNYHVCRWQQFLHERFMSLMLALSGALQRVLIAQKSFLAVVVAKTSCYDSDNVAKRLLVALAFA